MKKAKLLATGAFLMSLGWAAAQVCTPDVIYTDSAMGVYPHCEDIQDTLIINVPYSQELTIKIDATVGGFATIDSVILTGVTGLPAGVNYSCEPANCTWMGNSLGCALLSGTPTTQGVNNLSADVYVYTNIADAPYSWSWCSLIVDQQTSVIENEIRNLNSLTILNNTYNPADQWISLNLYSPSRQTGSLIIHDMVGALVYSKPLGLSKGANEINYSAANFPSGIYLYTIETPGGRVTQRMTVVKE